MLFNYREVLEIYGTDYKLKRAISSKRIYRIESGIYSDGKDNFTEYELVLKKYPAAFLVKNSALHHIGFIQAEPDVIHLGTARNALRIHDKRIQQHFYSGLVNAGNRSSLIHTYESANNNEIRLLNLSLLFRDLIRDRAHYERETLFAILQKFRDCQYFADSDFDECDFLIRLLSDGELFDLVEAVCNEAQVRKWLLDFDKNPDLE